MTTNILIIDDDKELCALLADYLQSEGFSTAAIHDGAEAITHCKRVRDTHEKADAIVLDIMLPGLQGLDVLRQLRSFSNIPVLMLTARGEDTDRILGLELGADDYLAKPCNPRELAARLRAILRRSQSAKENTPCVQLQVGATHVDTAQRRATHAGIDLQLTSAEFNVLQVLLSKAGEIVTKDELSELALGRSLSAYDRSIDVHVSKIRKKLTAQGADKLIVSVRGIGYQFTVSAAER